MRITDMQNTPIRAVIYARLSQAKVKGEESDSIANQVKAARLLAQRSGYELVGEFKDDDISGYKGGRRPAFGRMLAGMANGDFDLILVRHVDRLSRNDGDSSLVRTACARYGVKWQTLDGAVTDPGTSGGAFNAKVLSAVAELESEIKSERLRMYFASQAERGLLQASKGTFGYDDADRSKIVPWEADLIRAAYDAVAGGKTVGSIVRLWNEKKIPQRKRGSRWSYAHLNSILRRPRNAGLVAYHGELIQGVTGSWETIIDLDTWHTVQAILNDPGRKTSPGFLPKHLSSGIARCGVCGAVMRSNTTTDKRAGTRYTILRCEAPKNGTRHASARLDDLDPMVRNALMVAFMYGPDAILPAEATVDARGLQRRLQAIQEARVDILDLIRDRLTTKAQATTQLTSLSEEETGIRKQLEEARTANAGAHMLLDLRSDLWGDMTWIEQGIETFYGQSEELREQLEERFDALSVEDRRGLVANLLDIRVDPGRGRGKYRITHKVVTLLNPSTEVRASA